MNLLIAKLHVVASGLFISLMLSACGGGNTDAMLNSAKEYIAKNDNKAAVIQIKNALQKDPNLAEARMMLGSVLLTTGDAAAAELEFRKALELKFAPELVIPKLAQTMLARGQVKKLTDEFAKTELGTNSSRADLQVSLSSAYAAQGKADLAQDALAAALSAQPDFPAALIAQARQKVGLKDFDGALNSIDAIVAKTPASFEAWKLKGDIHLLAKNQPSEALAAYQKVLEIKPDYIPAHTAIVTLYLSQQKMADVDKRIDALKKIAPNHPQTLYFQTQVAYLKRDFKAARETSQQLLKLTPDNPKSLEMAGAVEFQLNSLIQAESLLSKALQVAPELGLARRLLSLAYLRSGQAAKALATLTPLLQKDAPDSALYSIAGEAHLQNGDVKKAEDYFVKAAKLDPKNARNRTSLALTHLIDGKAESAFGELQDIASSDSGVTADLALVSVHLRRKEFDKALKAIEGIEKKQPDKPLAANLRGQTLLAKNDIPGARRSFERALEIDPTFFSAVASLATLDMMDKKPEDAKKRMESVLARDPRNGQALLALAELSARSGSDSKEVAAMIAKAVEANPTDAKPRLLLIDHYLRNKDAQQALSLAQNAVAALPDSPELLDALGRAQSATGDMNQAIATFNKVAGLRPQSPIPLMRLADAYIAAKNKEAAAQSLRKVLEIRPDWLDAQRGLIMLNLDAKNYSDALAMARSVQKQRPKEPVGYVFEGDISAAQQKWDAATQAYGSGLKVAPSSELAIKSHASLMGSSKSSEADKFELSWLKAHPNDAAFAFYLGDAAIARKDFIAAEKYYSVVVKLQPTNAVAYNNLAWAGGQLKKDVAISHAEMANKLAPNQPAFMDTLAMLLSDKNEYAKALEWQTKAVTLQPQNALLKLDLAKIHIKGGKKDLAKKELDELAKMGGKFPGQAEVAELLKTL